MYEPSVPVVVMHCSLFESIAILLVLLFNNKTLTPETLCSFASFTPSLLASTHTVPITFLVSLWLSSGSTFTSVFSKCLTVCDTEFVSTSPISSCVNLALFDISVSFSIEFATTCTFIVTFCPADK